MKKELRKTSIVCTIGPASEDIPEEMIKAGMDVARINFSHGGPEEQREKVDKIKEARDKLAVAVSLMLDTQGPEVRLGLFKENIKEGVLLNVGDKIQLVNTGEESDGRRFSVSYPELYKDVEIGARLLLDDGEIELKVEEIKNEEIHCLVTDGGYIKPRKGLNAPGIHLNIPALKEKDKKDILYGIEADFDYIAASFVRNKKDVIDIREFLDQNGGENIKIIAKIENQSGLDNISEILENCDGLMVARGDLAVEVPLDMVPVYQKKLIFEANTKGKIVIVATQMLESMIKCSMPTRAEVSDVANAVYDKAGAVMLSGESAVGCAPTRCVEVMSKIAKTTEQNIHYWGRINFEKRDVDTLDRKSAYITVKASQAVGAAAIIAYTHTGDSVREIAGMGPQSPIFAVTDNKKTFNQLSLAWNVFPIYIKHNIEIDKMLEEAISRLRKVGILEDGDIAYLTGGRDFVKDAKESKRTGGIAIF